MRRGNGIRDGRDLSPGGAEAVVLPLVEANADVARTILPPLVSTKATSRPPPS